MATLKLIGLLAELAQTSEVCVQLAKPMKLRNLLPNTLPEDRMVVLVNQEGGTLDSVVNDEDKVLILPVISGG